jgi:hypothetical protein
VVDEPARRYNGSRNDPWPGFPAEQGGREPRGGLYSRSKLEVREGNRPVLKAPQNDSPFRPDPPEGLDLTDTLRSWPYEEAKAIRRLKAKDGREIIQVRLPLGIEQYEMHGRPDGSKPEGCESWMDHYLAVAKETTARTGSYQLEEEDFQRLQAEGLLYYYRYLLFFQMQEYELCARDTSRNLTLLDFVAAHSAGDIGEPLEQYRPYILRMHVMARALTEIQGRNDVKVALRILKQGLREVRLLKAPTGNQVFEWEKVRAVRSLEDLIGQLESHVPPSRRVLLERQLRSAIEEENYEKAASLRDQIASMEKKDPKTQGT